jgi:hypothetical protein
MFKPGCALTGFANAVFALGQVFEMKANLDHF